MRVSADEEKLSFSPFYDLFVYHFKIKSFSFFSHSFPNRESPFFDVDYTISSNKKQARKNYISLTLNFLSQSLCRFAQPSPLFKTSTQPRKRKGTRRHQEFTTRRSDTSQQVCWRVEGLECSDGAGLAAAGCVRACVRVSVVVFVE